MICIDATAVNCSYVKLQFPHRFTYFVPVQQLLANERQIDCDVVWTCMDDDKKSIIGPVGVAATVQCYWWLIIITSQSVLISVPIPLIHPPRLWMQDVIFRENSRNNRVPFSLFSVNVHGRYIIYVRGLPFDQSVDRSTTVSLILHYVWGCWCVVSRSSGYDRKTCLSRVKIFCGMRNFSRYNMRNINVE